MIEFILATFCTCLIFLMCWEICNDIFSDAGIEYLAWLASSVAVVCLTFGTVAFIRG